VLGCHHHLIYKLFIAKGFNFEFAIWMSWNHDEVDFFVLLTGHIFTSSTSQTTLRFL